MILTIPKDQLPPHRSHTATTVRQKNRVQCKKSFYGFPKKQYGDFSIQVARIVKQMRNLNDFWLEGKAIIQVENGVSRQAGCLRLYNSNRLDLQSEQNLDVRLKEIQGQIRKLTQRFTQGYRVTFRLHQWID